MSVANAVNQTGMAANAANERSAIRNTEETKSRREVKNYGKTVGEPQLSEKAQKYYEELKKKYKNLDFVLVSRDQKENAKANAAKYANPAKMVVLIDEDKIERMATDESFRKQYEGILNNAGNKLSEMKSKLGNTGAKVKGFGMQVNEDGTASFFAVLKKSSAEQKARIERKQAENKAARKKAAKEEQEERVKDRNKKDVHSKEDEGRIESDEEDTVMISAGSMDELMQKIEDHMQNERMDMVQTEEEKMLGQHIDFHG